MVTIQSSSKNGTALVKYLLDEDSHRDNIDRNLYVTTVNLMPDKEHDSVQYIRQFKADWNLARSRHQVQMRHMIISASRKEWMSDNENEAAFEFGELVADYIKEYYPDRRALVAVQADGSGYYLDSEGEIIRNKNGKPVRSEEKAKKLSGEAYVKEEHVLHAHVALSDCDMTDAKGVDTPKTRFPFLKETFDDFFTKQTGIEIDLGQKRGNAKYLKNQLLEENISKDGKYVSFKDDLADRINQCIGISNNMDEFYNNLPDFGVRLKKNKHGDVFHQSKKYGRYVTFELVDQSRTIEGQRYSNDVMVDGELREAGSLMRCSLRSYNFDSEGYDLDSIADRIANREVYSKASKSVNIHDFYMTGMQQVDDSTYQEELDKENHDYFAAMKQKAEEDDKIRQAEREAELLGDEEPIETSEERWARKEAIWAYKARKKAEREAANKKVESVVVESEVDEIPTISDVSVNHINEVLEKSRQLDERFRESQLQEDTEDTVSGRKKLY